MQFPRILFEFTLTPNDRAAIMSGTIRKEDRKEDNTKIRFVQTDLRSGHPIIVIEEAGEADSMGATQWHKKDYPAKIAMALLASHTIAMGNHFRDKLADLLVDTGDDRLDPACWVAGAERLHRRLVTAVSDVCHVIKESWSQIVYNDGSLDEQELEIAVRKALNVPALASQESKEGWEP